ncbi:thiamine phosphate synthase [Aeromicrobium fastidiosum]|uniref:thiamine phosphate synthase n=1 Tax=Aeromicrobium fastidiosum TaxID=52699 RepID=UPI002023698C|nr:thiamine phosphate synthase [Aeromicrobium fastidiosum]MCL8251329.1 thiamine phosphate synthase [Aeromicrobium fastidiosum]
MSVDLRVYLVTDPRTDDLLDVVSRAVAGGVTSVQVRHKDAAPDERIDLVRRLRDALPAHVAVIANDDLEAARWADGLHVGVDDVAPSTARAVLGPDAVIGWSVNDLAQLDDDVEMSASDYVAVSPVWATATKPDASEPLGLDGVRAVVERAGGRVPVVGIGGIDSTTAGLVVEAGASGVAVVSAICAAADPTSAAADLRRAVDGALRAAVERAGR